MPVDNNKLAHFCAAPPQASAHALDGGNHDYTDNATGIKYLVMCDYAKTLALSAAASVSALAMIAY